MSLNKVILLGNLTRDPELKYLPSGTAVAEFGLALNRRFRGQDGQQREEVCFVDIQVFGRQAETSAEYLSKGRQALIEGRLKLDQWETQDGQKRSKMRVCADRVQFIGGRGGNQSSPNQGASSAPPSPDMTDDDVPF